MNAPRERDGSQADHSYSAQSLGSGLLCRSALSGVLLPDSWTITAPNELYRSWASSVCKHPYRILANDRSSSSLELVAQWRQ
jgi:hypothetical protein